MNNDSLISDADINELPEPQRALAEAVGIDALMKFADNFGGERLYIPKSDSILRNMRDKRIREEFNGYNIRELSRKYDLSTVQIRNIVRKSETK